MPILSTHQGLQGSRETRDSYRRDEPAGPPPRVPQRSHRDLDEAERQPRRWPMWVAIGLLACAFLGGCWYGRNALDDHARQLSSISGWKVNIELLESGLRAAERRLNALPAELAAVSARTSAFEGKLAAGNQGVRKELQGATAALRKEIRGANDAQARTARALETRVQQQVDELRQADAAGRAQLAARIGQLDRRIASTGTELAATREDVAGEASQMRRELFRTQDRLERVASFNNRPRERFEAAKGTSQALGDRMLLHINRIDPRYREFDGWVQLVDEGKFLWLRKQGVLQAVGFHAGPQRLRYDLIVTGLTPSGVSGYLILPSDGETAGARLPAEATARPTLGR